jgi:two-component sensor histidine kinase
MSNIINFSTETSHLGSSEADHRITNNLSVISNLVRLKARHQNVDDVRQFLVDVACRIDTVARLHRLLAHPNGGDVPIAHFLRDVCEAMKEIAGSDERLHVAIECPESVRLAPESALQLGLLTAELFSNSIKYAHPTGIPTSIEVRCLQNHQMMIFSFEDDGIGFPENFDPDRSDSLGMHILRSLSHQLGGACEWQDLGIGLRFVCRFPLVRVTGQTRG